MEHRTPSKPKSPIAIKPNDLLLLDLVLSLQVISFYSNAIVNESVCMRIDISQLIIIECVPVYI